MPVSLPEAPIIVSCKMSVWFANMDDYRAHELHRRCIKTLELLFFIIKN